MRGATKRNMPAKCDILPAEQDVTEMRLGDSLCLERFKHAGKPLESEVRAKIPR